MNRTIKFRGLRTDGKGWVYGDLKRVNDNRFGGQWTYIWVDTEETEDSGEEIQVEPYTVGQFTGLFDKNGVEIYEGDFISNGTSDRVLVIWRQDLASFALSKNGWMYDHYFGEAVDPGYCEVIGNTHTQDGGQEG